MQTFGGVRSTVLLVSSIENIHIHLGLVHLI